MLFLDELPEFRKDVIEARANQGPQRHDCPRAPESFLSGRFMLLAAMNPCPCGYLGDARDRCHCTRRISDAIGRACLVRC